MLRRSVPVRYRVTAPRRLRANRFAPCRGWSARSPAARGLVTLALRRSEHSPWHGCNSPVLRQAPFWKAPCHPTIYRPVGAAPDSIASPLRSPEPLQRLLPLQPERRSEEHTSELQSLMRISYAVFCLKKKIQQMTK